MRRSCLHKRPLAQCELGSCMGPCAVCCCRVSSQPAGSVFTAGLAESAVADDSERIVEIFTAFHGPRPSERWGEMFTRRCKDVTLVFEKGSVAFREDRWKSAQPQAQGTDQVRATRVTHTWQTTESFLSEVRMRGSSGVQHGTVPDSISDDGLVRDAGEGCWQGEVVGRPAVPEGELCGNGEAVRGDPGALAWEADIHDRHETLGLAELGLPEDAAGALAACTSLWAAADDAAARPELQRDVRRPSPCAKFGGCRRTSISVLSLHKAARTLPQPRKRGALDRQGRM
eukprot:s745_g5.t16